MATATAAAGGGRWGASLLHDAESAADDAPNGLPGLRVVGKRLVGHALLKLENAWFGGGVCRNGFVNVGGHGFIADF